MTMVIEVVEAPVVKLTKQERKLCSDFTIRMHGKSIASRRDGQDPDKIANDFGLGLEAEFACFKLLPWTSAPDTAVYIDRSLCSFAPDLSCFEVKRGSTYRSQTSWVFQKGALRANSGGYTALMVEEGGDFSLRYILDYEAVREHAREMKKPSLRDTKVALYDEDLKYLVTHHMTLAQIEERFQPEKEAA